MRKKLLTILVSIFMIMATFTVNVFAEDYSTVDQILATVDGSFPSAAGAVPGNAWVKSGNISKKSYKDTTRLYIGDDQIDLGSSVSKVDDNTYTATSSQSGTITFKLENGNLINITHVGGYFMESTNGTYAPITIADILPSDFPKAIDDTVPDKAWISSNNKCYISKNNNLCFERGSSSYSLGVGAKVSRIDTNSFKCISYNIIFNIENNKLISIEKNITDNPNGLNGIYTAPKGTQDNPWDIGATGNESNVKAWLTEVSPATDPKTYTLTIQGTGAMADLDTGDWPWNSNRSSITSVVIGDGITKVGKCSMRSFTNLVNVSLPSSLETIGERAFFDCSLLSSITIPNNVTTIDVGAFELCINLNNVKIPSKVTNIGDEAFYQCSKLITVICEATTPPKIDSDPFGLCDANLKIQVPIASYEDYINEDSNFSKGWYAYKDIIDAYVTVADLLIDFPTSSDDGWVSDKGNKIYLASESSLSCPDLPSPLDISTILTESGNNYTYDVGFYTLKFVIEDNELNNIQIVNAVSLYKYLEGTYEPYKYENPTISVQTGSTEEIEFVTNAVYENDSDVTVKVDGNTLTLNTHYTQYQGSTHVILKGSYLSTLAAGTHTITIGVNGYSDINQDFTITAESTPSSDPTPRYKVPNTGVEGVTNNHSLLKLSSLSLLAVGTYLVIKKRKDNY